MKNGGFVSTTLLAIVIVVLLFLFILGVVHFVV